MKTISLLFTAVLFACNGNVREKQMAHTQAEAADLLKSFYTEYINSCSDGVAIDSDGDMENIVKKYFTGALYKKLEPLEFDYDPVLKAQDCDTAVLKTLTVTSSEKDNTSYTVCYNDSYSNELICINLKVISSKGKLMISDIEIEQ